MKKQKRSFELEEKELDFSKDFGGIELGDESDDDVIDLDDEIVDVSGGMDDDEDLNLDVELLDVDSDMGFGDLDTKSRDSSDGDDFLHGDLLKEFSLGGDSDERPAEPAAEKELDVLGQGAIDDLLKGFDFDDGPSFDSNAKSEVDLLDESPNLEDVTSLIDEEEEGIFATSVKEDRKPPIEELKKTAPAMPVPLPATQAVGSLDAVVAQIESRLVEMIREMVEARLPDVVRSVLREEIEMLKREF